MRAGPFAARRGKHADVGDLRASSKSLFVKILAAPVVAVAWLLAARIVISALGVNGYATYTIVVGIAVLLPFADLGMGAAVMDAVARRSPDDEESVPRTLITTLRALIAVSTALIVIAVSLGICGFWAQILGVPAGNSTEISVTLALITFAAGLPLGIGPRLLTGAGLNYVAAALQGLSAILMVCLIELASLVTSRLEAYVITPFLATALSNGVGIYLGSRKLQIPFWSILKRLFDREFRGTTVRHVAMPMLAISVTVPIAYQSDRIVLSHTSSLEEVARYSISYQFFSPLLGLISTAGIALWPVFASARNSSKYPTWQRFRFVQRSFGVLGGALALVLVLAGPPLSKFVGQDSISVHYGLFMFFGGLLILQAVSYPMAMILTDTSGLHFQAVLHVLMVALNLPLSILLSYKLGAPGPIIASLIAIMAALFFPQLWRVRSQTRSGPG